MSMEQVKPHEWWEIGREVNPIHKVFWVDTAFFLGLSLCAAWQVWDYAMYKARAGNKGYLFSGAHHLWRVAFQCVLALILITAEIIWPGRTMMHYISAFAILLDAALLYIHTERVPMPLLFPALEAILTVCLAFGVSDKGRMTTPILLMIASFRLVAELWPLKADEDAFKIVSGTLMASLAWHWFPLLEAIDLYNVSEADKKPNDNEYNNTVDFLFFCNLVMGHLTVLSLLWRILPGFFANELAYERQDTTVAKTTEVGVFGS